MKTYLVQQKIRALVNQYSLYQANDDGSAGPMVAFAQQKRFAFKERVDFYQDESKQSPAFSVQARQLMDFGARYDVQAADGTLLGTLGKDFKSSLLRSTWHIFAPGAEDKPLLVVRERSPAVAVVRRLWQLVPFVNEFPFFVKYHFDFIDPASNQRVASYDKTTTLRDHYRLTIEAATAENIDPRVLLALGVMMDALQSR